MDRRLIEKAQGIAKGKDPREAWLDLKSWAHMKGSSHERAAVFAFLEEHSMNPAAVPLFPEVLREAAGASASLEKKERMALIGLADHASTTARGGFTIMDPSKDRRFMMPSSGNRPEPALHFRPERADHFPRPGAKGPLAPTREIGRYIEARDMVYRTNDELHGMPAPIRKPERGFQRKEIPIPSEELTSLSMPHSPSKSVMKADKGEELVKSLIRKLKEQSPERRGAKKEAEPVKGAPAEKPSKAFKKEPAKRRAENRGKAKPQKKTKKAAKKKASMKKTTKKAPKKRRK